MQGAEAVDAVVKLMVPTANLSTSLAEAFLREGKQIDTLTQDQFDVLKGLRLQTRAAIVGGAGTGKTVLAMEKTRRLVDQGLRVLFLCFSSNLAAWIGKTLEAKDNALLEVLTFHQLTQRFIKRSQLPVDPQQKFEEFVERAADLLKDRENGILYIFFDDHQRLYTQMSNIPFKAQPFVLFKNCRNTQEIFSALKRYLPASWPMWGFRGRVTMWR